MWGKKNKELLLLFFRENLSVYTLGKEKFAIDSYVTSWKFYDAKYKLRYF